MSSPILYYRILWREAKFVDYQLKVVRLRLFEGFLLCSYYVCALLDSLVVCEEEHGGYTSASCNNLLRGASPI